MKVLILMLLFALPGFAKDKPQYTYQDGVLKAFRIETTGKSCSTSADTTGNVNATTDDSGQTSGTVKATTYGSTSCRDTERALYTVASGDNVFVLTPAYDLATKATVGLTLGWGAMFIKNSVLANRLPGTAIELRADGDHYFVRIGKRESMYSVVEAK